MKFEGDIKKYITKPMEELDIKFFNIQPKFENNEKETMISLVGPLWQTLIEKSKNNNFNGLIRFDLVPSFDKQNKMSIQGIYEVNTGQPEEPIAFAQIDDILKEKKIIQPIKKISHEINHRFDKKINIIIGKNKLKDAWAKDFIKVIKKNKLLDINQINLEKFKKHNGIPTWRLGDLRLDGESHFPKNFVKWLSKNPSNIFNSFCLNGNNPGNKKFLLTHKDEKIKNILGDNKLLKENNVQWAIKNQQKLVMKPNGGASGHDITFGEQISKNEWKDILKKNMHSNTSFGLWEKKYLPKINIQNHNMAIDINPVFWAQGKNLKYLYTISRITPWKEYQKTKIINVAAGGGLTYPYE